VPVSPPAAQIDFTGFDHIDLVVPNRAKARHFFADQLGLEVLGESPEHTYLLFGDQVLGLHDGPAELRVTGIDHLALRVGSWTGLRNRVRRARLTVVSEKERDDSRSLFLRGPDGLSVELVYRPDPGVHTTHRGFTVPVPPATDDENDDAEAPLPAATPSRRRR
jgi:catechol 2,3-dioxygenase-like lactoylglutathione lyase family enzyme